MTIARKLFSLLLALLIASPLCCCSGRLLAAAEKSSAHSCCGSGKTQKSEQACDCGTHAVRQLESPDVPHFPPAATAPDPVVMAGPRPGLDPPDRVRPVRPEAMDTGPPRWRLVRWQRFLI